MEKYEFLSRTGEGAYGSVWRARDKNTGMLAAIKKMKEVPTTEEEGEIAMREVRVLQLAKHVNIVNLLEAYKSQSGRLYLVFEYVERTLLQELKANRSGMPPAIVKSITWQLLQALSYLHRKQIIHRDIKPSNILMTESGVVKICDFGFARACANSTSDPAYTTYVVTRWYRPPEVLVGDTYGPPVDVWALGCIFAEMLVGRPLFPGRNHHDQLWLILKCLGTMTERQLELLDSDPQFACFRLPNASEVEPLEQRLGNIPAPAMQLLRACLNPDPKQRASADELLAMPYFNGVTDTLPLDDLLAYPDQEMRTKLERVIAQRQTPVGPPHAAAAQPPSNGKRPLAPANKQQHFVPTTGGTSPSRQAPSHGAGGHPLPSKTSNASRTEPSGEHQRPPLLRHITAPAGGLAAKILHHPPLHSLPEHPQQQQYHYYQRSRASSDGSQGSSPQLQAQGSHAGSGPLLGALAPPRGRPWQVSGDGSGDNIVGPFVRQVSGPVSTQYQQHALPSGASEHSALAGRSQRSTWNGTSGPRLSATGGSATNNGNCVQGGQGGTCSLNSSLNNNHNHNNAYSSGPHASGSTAVHRKAQSLAGNEPLPLGGSVPITSRGPIGLNGVSGRSLAPVAGPGTGAGANSAPVASQLPPTQFGFPSTSNIQRLTPSPPPHMYGGGLRSNNSGTIAPLVGIPYRVSGDGSSNAVGSHGLQPGTHSVTGYGKPPAGPGAAGLYSNSGPIPVGTLDSEGSDGDEIDTSADQNEGRRASDTVLYAAAALKEAKNRLDKASIMVPAPGRQSSSVLEGPNSSGGGAVPSFGRSSGHAAAGLPSPDSAVPPSLPPLHQTPRRMSAPETALTASLHPTALLHSTANGGTGAGRHAAPAMLQAPATGGYLQRHCTKQHPSQAQQHSAPQGQGSANSSHSHAAGSADIDNADGASTAHVFLPALDVGLGKAARGQAAGAASGIGPGVGVVRRPSKGSIRLTAPDVPQCKREEPAALEAVPE